MRRTPAALALLAALALTGCANAGYTSDGAKINVVSVEIPDGRTVVCVNVASSVDCDWDGAKR